MITREELERLTLQCQAGNPVPWMEALLSVETKDNQVVPFQLGAVTRKIAEVA